MVLSGCGGSGHGRSITLYSAQSGQTTSAIIAAFEQATGIAVNVRNSEEDILIGQIVNEGSRSPADVIYTENSPALEDLQERGLLAPLDAATLAKVPARYSSAAGRWTSVSARVTVLIYNPKPITLGELPTSVADLASPRYKEKFALATFSRSSQRLRTAMGGQRRSLGLPGSRATSVITSTPTARTSRFA